MRVFDRLVGLETEYAIVPSSEQGWEGMSRVRCYRALVASLRQRIPVATAQHFKEGVFTASSGAVWFETERFAVDTGLVEGATPECRGPVEAALYQQAQDRLLAECAEAAAVPGGFRLLKNDRDAAGNIYGAQENYEATIATGWRLAAWRTGLVLLLIPAVFSWLGMIVLLAAIVAYFALASLVTWTCRRVFGRATWIEPWLVHPDWLGAGESLTPVPAWLERVMLGLFNLLVLPLAVPLAMLVRVTAFVPQRRALEAFLMTRAVISGAGMLDDDGQFGLSDKGPAMNCRIGYGDFVFRRPVFNFGHFLKSFGTEIPLAPREFGELFARRQRLQIALGDSNMAPTAELLRIATTTLVLDVAEAEAEGEEDWPRLCHPLRALRAICADPSLRVAVALRDGSKQTAVEIQRYYAERCHECLSRQLTIPREALAACQMWLNTLDALEHSRDSLIGRLDWVTKLHLLDSAGAGLPWEARKKIDLRYHELSSEGYFRRLEAAGRTENWLDEELLARAMRSPPPDSPATMRGHFIREFGGDEQALSVNWKKVTIGRGRNRRVIRLSRYRRAAKLDD